MSDWADKEVLKLEKDFREGVISKECYEQCICDICHEVMIEENNTGRDSQMPF